MSSDNNKPRNVFDKIDMSKIGSGHRFTEGSWKRGILSGVKKEAGLKGQLKNLQVAGRRGATKNLSTKNLKQIHGLIADRIKGKVASSGTYLSRRDKIAIMKESRKLVKTKGSGFTWEDRKDLKRVVNTMRSKRKNAIRRGRRDISPSLSSSSSLNTPSSSSTDVSSGISLLRSLK